MFIYFHFSKDFSLTNVILSGIVYYINANVCIYIFTVQRKRLRKKIAVKKFYGQICANTLICGRLAVWRILWQLQLKTLQKK